MGISVIPVFVKKCLIMPFYLACSHPFTFGMACFSFLVYRKFPSFFGVVVSFSPVVICTFVFLEIILISSRTHSSEVEEEEKKIDCSSLDGRELRGKRAMFLFKEDDDGRNRDFNVLDAMPSSSQRYGKEVHSENFFEDNLVQSALKGSKVSHHLIKNSREKRPSMTKGDDTLDSNAEGIDRLDASIEEVTPMLDELHPLLDTKSTQPANVSDSYDSSIESSHGHDSDDNDSDEEETENLENEEEEDAQEEKERQAEVVMKWTADDEKNLRDVGKIELERNQRLEHLIAKRRARNYQRSETEKNLIDLDSNEPTNVVEELSRLLVMIPPRKNPFDLPCGSEENDLVPGSAPSVLLPRKNPFELPCEHVMPNNDEVMSGDPSHQQDFSAFQPKDMPFKRFESFAIGESPGDYKPEKRRTRFRPYFVAERNDADETNYGGLQHQLSGISDSKVSSTLESESVSSISNHSNHAIHNDILEQEIHRVSGLISADNNRIQSIEHEGQSSEDDDENSDNDNDGSTETEQEAHKENSINDGHISVNAKDGIIYNSQSKAETKHGVITVPHTSNSKEKELTEDGSDETSTSSCTEDDQSSSSDSKDIEIVNELQIVEPLYDCSPSSMPKSLSNITSIQDSLHYLDRQGSDSNSSLASDMQVEISEPGSPLRLSDQNLLSGEELSSDSNGPWVASSNLSFIDMHESGTREVKEIREHDVIEADFTVTDEGHNNNSIAPSSIVSETKSNTSTSNFPLMQMEESSNEGGGLSQFDGINKIANAKSLRRLVTSDNLSSHTSFKGQTSVEDPVPPSPPSNFGIVESQISILPPIPEEILEEFRHEEEKVTSDVFEGGHLVTKENSLHEATVAPEGNPTAISSLLHTTNEKTGLVGGAHIDGFNNEASGSSPVKKKSEVSDSNSTSSSSSSSSDSD